MSAASASARGDPEVSIILAVLNEVDNLRQLLPRLTAAGLPPWEIVVVDDGSTDGSREFLREEAQRDPRVRTIFHDGKQTTLRAQCVGLAASRGRYLVIMDADLQHPPELLPRMLGKLASGDALVVATRYRDGGSPGPRPPLRALLSRGAEWLTKLLLPESRGVSDPVSGYFAFRREVFVGVDPLYRGYKLLLFVLVMSRGRSVGEVGFVFRARTEGASKVAQGTRFLRVFLTELLLARRYSARSRHAPGFPLSAPEAGA